MEWNTILLKTTPKKKASSHIIKGICTINEKIYLLEYILFSNFEWWMAYELDGVENYDPQTSYLLQESTLFYNSTTNQFYTKDELPTTIKNLITVYEF